LLLIEWMVAIRTTVHVHMERLAIEDLGADKVIWNDLVGYGADTNSGIEGSVAAVMKPESSLVRKAIVAATSSNVRSVPSVSAPIASPTLRG
jgi:hypothetical protein